MKKDIKITRKEIIFIIIELIVLIALNISTKRFFKGNIQNIIATIATILISIRLTIINKKQLHMPYFLIDNNVFTAVLVASGFNNINGLSPLISMFRLVAIVLCCVIFIVNNKLYEKIYIKD